MSREQKIVLAGATSGIAAMIASMWILFHALPAPDGIHSIGDRLGYAARWNALPALLLLLMLAAVGNGRFLSEAIDPTRGAEDRKTMINGRVADNTAQQLLLFLAATMALATVVAPDSVQVIAAASITFTIMRIAFWIGYRIDPLHRAFGFSSTAYLNLGLLVTALWLSVR
jgi:hypothetical protein